MTKTGRADKKKANTQYGVGLQQKRQRNALGFEKYQERAVSLTHKFMILKAFGPEHCQVLNRLFPSDCQFMNTTFSPLQQNLGPGL